MSNTIIRIDAAPIRMNVSAAQGPGGLPGIPGPNSVTSATASNSTADLDLLNVTTATATITGMSVAPTAATTTSTTQLATTAFVQQELASGVAVAKNLEVFAHNGTGVTITKGSIVYINGAASGTPRITLSQANNEVNSARTIGFAKADIANGADGFVITEGELENVKTTDANGSGIIGPGIQIYLSPTVPGGFTQTKPSAPNHLVYVGVITRASTGVNLDGRILVGIQNGYELHELHDVAISSPAAKQVVKRNAGNTLWVNEAIVSADVSDATSAATANRIVIRDGSGAASLSGLTNSGNLNLATGTTFTYGTGIAASHRTALGLGSLATQSGTFSGDSSGNNTGDQNLSNLLSRRTYLEVSGTTPTFGPSLVDQDYLTNGRRVWLDGSGGSLLWDGFNWVLELNSGGIVYQATKASGSYEPWLLTGWTVVVGSGQPTFDEDPFLTNSADPLGSGVSLALYLPADTNGGFLTAGTGGTLPLARGGTGAATASDARIALGGVGDSSTGAALFGAADAAAANTILANNIVTKSADFTLAQTDAGTYMRLTKTGSTQTITLPTSGISAGAEFQFYRITTQSLAFSGGTVNGTANLASVPTNGAFALKHIASGTYDFI
jgi:hypothetical protein